MEHRESGADLSSAGNSAGKFTSELAGFDSAGEYALARRMSQVGLPLLILLAFVPALLWGVVTGSVSGTVRDSSGAVVPGVSVIVENTATGITQTIVTDSAGFYNFPALAIGHYNIAFQKSGFKRYQKSGVVINVNTFLRVDAALQVGSVTSEITVTGSAVAVNTQNAQLGEVIGGTEMEALPLNGRAFTDLLTLQPGVVPFNVTQYGSLSPSGTLDNGDLSMSGQRDVNNGYMVNGANTVEGNGGGATIIPNLDSIAEFRIITSNAGAEYGNYSGGQVNVATKSGTNQFHGDAFDFLRNSDMDARNFYSPDRGVLRQNMFGGTLGGPVIHNKIFFFGDYQGTRQETGVDTGNIAVPSPAERTGDFSDEANLLTGTVNGTFFANTLASRLGYPVSAGEPYYMAGCTSSAACVFPNAVIPQRAWSPVSAKAIPLIPLPNVGSYFSTAANSATLRDDKGGVKVDGNSRLGMMSAYYLFDPWNQMNPYNPGYGGSTVPGFPSETVGKAQLLVLNATTSLGSNNVNQFTFSYMRNKNIQGLSAGSGAGPTLASLGFAPPDQGGLYQESPAYANWPALSFDNYTLGAFNSVVSQFNNTYQWQDDFTKIVGTHTVKFGADYHLDQVDISHPNNGGNGAFGFNSPGETGVDFANMLIGAPGYFFQGAPAALDLRSYYIGVYGEDSWRVTPNLTFNYGVRWEATPYWWDSKNRNPATLPGIQSRIFPGAPEGYVFPGDPGVPKTLAYPRYNNFGPRLGLAYAPNVSGGLLHWLFGDAGKSSIRAGYGLYYTNVQGSATFNFAAAPYGLFYSSPAPPLFAQPFITRASGQNLGQRFPLPPLDPNNINWAQFEPISGNRNPLPESKSPYGEHVDFSIQRQFAANTLLSLSYVGSFGHHLLVNLDSNPGNPALCLSVSQLSQVMPGTPTCGPFGENGVYYPVTGGVINGTRGPFGPEFGGNGYFLDRGNSSYNALQVALRRTAGRAQFLLSYTYSKAMDDGSGFGDQVLPYNYSLFRGLSVYDLTHNFSFSYSYELPFDKLFRRDNRLTRGWRLAGITTFATGTPVQIAEVDDQSLLGSTGNSPFYGSTDEPNYTPGTILVDTNPRDGKPYFNTSLFSLEPLGGQGTSSKRFFHGPGINNWNLALLKDIRLTESKTLEFRGEFFNVFNHANFSLPDGYFHDSQFGLVGNASAGRVGQVAMKFIF